MQSLTIERITSRNYLYTRTCRPKRTIPLLFLTFLVLVFETQFPSAALGQTLGSGSVQGTITDKTGAVVSAATVTAVNVATQQTVTTKTTRSGFYALLSLPPGSYSVEVGAPGFQKYIQKNVSVIALATVTMNARLNIGNSTQSVTVTTQPPQIDTTDGTLETEIPQEAYNSLPIAMSGGPKDPLGFVGLTPGVSSGGNGTFDLNGGAGEASSIYVNGMPVDNILIGGSPTPITSSTSLEAVSDFQVMTSGIPAYYSGDGVVNIVLKRGTDQFHGSLYENIRNTAFDAAGYFSATTPVERQNEFGASLGGPIVRKKLFFFFNYDGYRLMEGRNPLFYSLPTLQERQGDFSALPVPIYDPDTTQCIGRICSRKQFPGNIIPADRISSISQFLQADLPKPINTGLADNYLNGFNQGANQNMYTADLDYEVNSNNKLTVTAQYGNETPVGTVYNGGTMLPLPYASTRFSPTDNHLIQVQDTQIFTPNLVNVVGYQYNRLGNGLDNYTTSGDWGTKAGLKGLPTDGVAADDFPPIAFSGANSPTSLAIYGFSAQQLNVTSANEFQDNVQWVRGNSNFTFGGYVQYAKNNTTTPTQLTAFNFSYVQTTGYSSKGVPIPTEGNSYASYLLGQVDTSSLADTTVPEVEGRYAAYAIYAQDNWKLSNKLSLNLGIRYIIDTPFVEAHNKLSFMNASLPNPEVDNFPGILQFAGNVTDGCNCRTLVQTKYNTFEPRIGFAYSPQLGTVFRGSYSIVSFRSAGLGGTSPNSGQLGFTASPSFVPPNSNGVEAFNWNAGIPPYTRAPFLAPTLNTGYNTTTGPTGGGISYPDPGHAGYPSYTAYWNLTVQQQLTASTAFSLSYAGSQTHRLGLARGYGIYSNQLNPEYLALGEILNQNATPANIAAAQAILPGVGPQYANFDGSVAQMLRPFPQYTAINDQVADYGTGEYNSMQVLAEHLMGHHFFFLADYTWSREIDDAGGANARSLDAAGLRDAYDIKLDRTVDEGPTQVLKGSGSYLLPIGQGQALSFRSALLNNIVGHWTLSAIVSYSNGSYIGPFTSVCVLPNAGGCYADYNPSFTGSARINGPYGKNAAQGGPKVDPVPYININAFQNTKPFTYGTTPRVGAYRIKSDAGKNEEVAMDKEFNLTRDVSLELRADAFNLFNRTIWSAPVTDINSPAFGHITGQSNGPRQLQFEAYIRF